jgi:hypothetical protein
VFQAELADGPGGVVDRRVGANQDGALPVRVAGGDHVLVCRKGGGVAARAGEPVMGREEGVEVTGQLHARADQHDQVVADALQVGDQVRGQHDAELVLGDGLHRVLQELPPRERVEAGDRFVEDQQLRALGDAQREGQLGALAARQLPCALRGVHSLPSPWALKTAVTLRPPERRSERSS